MRIFLLSFLLSFAALFLLTSCISDSSGIYIFQESDALTEEEKEGIIAHIRQFIDKAQYKRLDPKNPKHYKGFRLSSAERRFIRNAPPIFKVHYTGRKRGELIVRWNFPNHRSIIIKRVGYLLSVGKNDWNVRVMTDRATGTIPGNYFGAKGEDIRRIPPEMRKALQSLPPASPQR